MIKRYKKLFKTNHRYTLDDLEVIAEKNKLEITDCSNDECPHITISTPEDDPLWQFNWINKDELVLSWTEWD